MLQERRGEGGGCVDGFGEGEEVVWVAAAEGEFLEEAVGIVRAFQEVGDAL